MYCGVHGVACYGIMICVQLHYLMRSCVLFCVCSPVKSVGYCGLCCGVNVVFVVVSMVCDIVWVVLW